MNTTPHALAVQHLGVSERVGPDTHPLIRWWLSLCDGMGDGQGDEVAWCSAFVNGMCWLLGPVVPRSSKANARSWLDVGEPIDLSDAVPGWDVVIFWRNDPTGWQGHVGFFDGLDAKGDVIVLGGNQGDRVSCAVYPASRLLGVRRLVAA